MKRTISLVALTIIMTMLALNVTAQDKKEVIKEKRTLPAFTGISVGGAFEVYLTQGEPQEVIVETHANFMENVMTQVNGSTLDISSKGLKNIHELNVYITVPEVKSVEASGAAEVKGRSTVRADELDLSASGASELSMEIQVTQLKTNTSGAAEMKLAGTAENHSGDVSGAGSLNARELNTEKSYLTVSGAASAYVHASEEIAGDVSGAGELKYSGNPQNNLTHTNNAEVYASEYDSVRVRMGRMDIEVKENPDTVRIRAGNRIIIIDEEGDVKYQRNKKHKFNGHWAGFDIGLNGYVNSDYNMNFPKEYEYLDLRMEKSIAIGINFFEQNIRLAKNQKWGMLTGLGLGFNDYRFLKPTRLSMDSSSLQGYLHEGISIRKSKLSIMYLTLPLLFEFQTDPWCRKTSFHFGAGMIMSTRLMSHTKIYYNEYNKEHTLVQWDPETNAYQPAFTSVSPNGPKVKDYGDWFLRPFKFDATVRVGWGIINLFATMSVNSLFRDDKGPELYPWSAGISLVNF
jgi:hypothetical protein